jgi:hypothetical protein
MRLRLNGLTYEGMCDIHIAQPGAHTPPFPTYHPYVRAPGTFPSILGPTCWVTQVGAAYRLGSTPKHLAARSSVCYNVLAEAGGGLVPIVVFFVFVIVVCGCVLALGYGLSSSEERPIGRRCRAPFWMHRRRTVRRQRVRCRFEG